MKFEDNIIILMILTFLFHYNLIALGNAVTVGLFIRKEMEFQLGRTKRWQCSSVRASISMSLSVSLSEIPNQKPSLDATNKIPLGSKHRPALQSEDKQIPQNTSVLLSSCHMIQRDTVLKWLGSIENNTAPHQNYLSQAMCRS